MPLTIQAIVCTVDFSPFSPCVVRHGVALARRAGVRLYLIHAVHDPQDGNGLPPCLVVSASHGVSGFRRLFIGTVVERMTRTLNRPMLVVKPTDGVDDDRFNGFRSAVVGCDSHGHWQRLAPLLPLLQADSASGIHLVHSMEGPMDKAMVDSDAASYGQAQQALQDRLNRQLREQARRLFLHADQFSIEVSPGVPEEMMLRIAHERASDMIMVGVRRSGKVGRWISGSTTEALLRHSPCSVLTVPEPLEQKNTGGYHQ
ncbi:MAG: universal stress protein [Desulfosarcina sp.]|nr:universal stress protein [Desulfosarcina sp.]MBC2766525.1 universal stress protein [Desulfosarcina sp.]